MWVRLPPRAPVLLKQQGLSANRCTNWHDCTDCAADPFHCVALALFNGARRFAASSVRQRGAFVFAALARAPKHPLVPSPIRGGKRAILVASRVCRVSAGLVSTRTARLTLASLSAFP